MSDAPQKEGAITGNEAKHLVHLLDDFSAKRHLLDELMVVHPAELTPDELAWYAETLRDAEEAVTAAWDMLESAQADATESISFERFRTAT
jgi:hypothetical protein